MYLCAVILVRSSLPHPKLEKVKHGLLQRKFYHSPYSFYIKFITCTTSVSNPSKHYYIYALSFLNAQKNPDSYCGSHGVCLDCTLLEDQVTVELGFFLYSSKHQFTRNYFYINNNVIVYEASISLILY